MEMPVDTLSLILFALVIFAVVLLAIDHEIYCRKGIQK